MVLFSQNNVSKRHLPYSQVYTVTYNPCQVTSMSFLQVSVFSGCQLGDYFPTQVASTKILVAMVPKVVTAWRIVVTKISSCQVNTTSRKGMKQLGIYFGSIFLLFSSESSQGPRSW